MIVKMDEWMEPTELEWKSESFLWDKGNELCYITGQQITIQMVYQFIFLFQEMNQLKKYI